MSTEQLIDAMPAKTANTKHLKKMCFILSKASLDSVYAVMVMANGARAEGLDASIFFTFFGLEAINKISMDHLHIATVGNPAMHIPTLLGGLPGMEAMATKMMQKELDRLDIPPVGEFMEILSDSGVDLYACKLAMDMFHLTKADLFEGVEDVLTIGDFYERVSAEGSQIVFI